MRKKLGVWLKMARNAGYARFPTLTHLMIDPPHMQTRRLDKSCSLSDAFLQRMCVAFQTAEPHTGHDVWANIETQSRDLRGALASGDLVQLREHLTDLFGGSALYGMAHISAFLKPGSPYGLEYFPLRCRDSLFALAEALGVRGLMSNQQTPLKEYIATLNGDLEQLIGSVEVALGHSLDPPALGGPPVAIVGSRVLNPDAIRHAYIMHRVQQIGINTESPILEIGGGFGCVARYASLRGYRNYTIIDLPFVNAIQAAFIADALGEDAVAMHGETTPAAVRLVPATATDTLASSYELVINMDSLPEIAEADAYVQMIKNKANLFLSVNQEANRLSHGFRQHVVPRLLDEAGGFKRLSRHPYWMEQGCAEELYSIVR